MGEGDCQLAVGLCEVLVLVLILGVLVVLFTDVGVVIAFIIWSGSLFSEVSRSGRIGIGSAAITIDGDNVRGRRNIRRSITPCRLGCVDRTRVTDLRMFVGHIVHDSGYNVGSIRSNLTVTVETGSLELPFSAYVRRVRMIRNGANISIRVVGTLLIGNDID